MKKPLLFVFDFDHTIVDENSDHVAYEMLPGGIPEDVKKLYRSGGGWTEFMRKIFQLLHTAGIDRETIENTINKIPPVAGVTTLLTNLHIHNCEIIIISDSNSLFIDNWLLQNQLKHTVAQVFTNPAWFDDAGMLHVKEYQNQEFCQLSERNLCKGYVLETYIRDRLNEGTEFERIAYAGDGKNDFCPILKLSVNDLAFPRKDYAIMKYLNNSEKVLAKIIPWTDGLEIWNEINNSIHF